MNAPPEGLLAHWGLEGAPCQLVAHRENRVFAVTLPQGRAALRLHRPGYHSPAALQSELDFMAHLAASGLRVPAPLPTRGGAYLVASGEPPVMADLLEWLEGAPLGRAGEPLPQTDPARPFHALGAVLALDARWALFGRVGVERLPPAISDSPLIDDDTALIGLLGVTYRFR